MEKTGRYWRCIKPPLYEFTLGRIYEEYQAINYRVIMSNTNSPHYTPEYSSTYIPYFVEHFPFKHYAEQIQREQIQSRAESTIL